MPFLSQHAGGFATVKLTSEGAEAFRLDVHSRQGGTAEIALDRADLVKLVKQAEKLLAAPAPVPTAPHARPRKGAGR